MQTAVTDAQFDASVGNVKSGFFRRCVAHFAVSVAAEKLDLPFDRLADQRLRCRSRLLTANNDRRLAIVQADIRDGIICIDPDREMREKCTFHRSSFLYTHK